MQQSFWKREGNPFLGPELARLKEFLAACGLDYDERIEYTVTLEADGKIIASGSCHGNVLKCVAVAEDYQGMGLLAQVVTELIYHLTARGISHYFLFTKPENRQIFRDMSFYEIAATDAILLMENHQQGIAKYVKQLVTETEDVMANGMMGKVVEARPAAERNAARERAGGVGAIVANCDPFTKGHQYLMETAAREVEWLHIFLLSQSNQRFSEEARFQMVGDGVAHIPNVILHKGSDYVVSPATFPTYFMKEKGLALRDNCLLDLAVFVKHIAPALRIRKRFAGTEPYCKVTRQYNECMRWFLPDHGVAFVEIPRLELATGVISASRVREQLERGGLETVRQMLPESSQRCVLWEGGHITVEEMLAARERRAAMQREMCLRTQSTLICFTLNIPGPVKVSELFSRLFRAGQDQIAKRLSQEQTECAESICTQERTGWEYFCVVAEDASKVKGWMVELEEACPASRLFDIDVFDHTGRKVSREELGFAGRTCLLCGEPAHSCGRSQKHSQEELNCEVERLIQMFLEEKATC